MKSISKKIKYAGIVFAIALLCIFAGCAQRGVRLEYFAEEGGYISGETVQTVTVGDYGAVVTAVPNEGYVFVKWSDGEVYPSRQDKDVRRSVSVTAEFARKEYTLTYATDGNGTVQGAAEQTVFLGGSGTEVTAVPNEGYEFSAWSDGVTEATRRETDVTASTAVKAKFAKKKYTLAYSAGSNGTVRGATEQTVEHGESGTEVTAVPDEGYEFVAWSDGATNATRREENADGNLAVEATFKKIKKGFTVTYLVKGHGRLFRSSPFVSAESQEVEYGKDAAPVSAKAFADYAFLGWSDGRTEEKRVDKNITSDITVTAYFGILVEYGVNENRGGRILGNTRQVFFEKDEGEECESVTAVADPGYVFAGWSDLGNEATRCDLVDGLTIRRYLAYFVPTEKTFTLDYGIASGVPAARQMTFRQNSMQSVKFDVPAAEGYTFCGWYADSDYRTKIADEEGRYLFGYALFYLDGDTLYAKWKRTDDGSDPYRVLLVFVDHFHAMLYSKTKKDYFEAEYRMGAFDYEASLWIARTFADVLNEWFEGEVIFEVDSYYTLLPLQSVTNEPVASNGLGMLRQGSFDANYILEVARLAQRYHGALTTVGFGDYIGEFHDFGGLAYGNNAIVFWDNFWRGFALHHEPMQDELEKWKSEDCNLNDSPMLVYLHEFAHIAEECSYSDSVYEFHKIEKMVAEEEVETTRLYLLNLVYSDGVACGIPMEYWKHQAVVWVSYVAIVIEFGSGGKIYVAGEADDRPVWEQSVIVRSVGYGSNLTIEAVADEGYRFVMWSDGVTTAIREDKNIVSDLIIKAIFEKIN